VVSDAVQVAHEVTVRFIVVTAGVVLVAIAITLAFGLLRRKSQSSAERAISPNDCREKALDWVRFLGDMRREAWPQQSPRESGRQHAEADPEAGGPREQ